MYNYLPSFLARSSERSVAKSHRTSNIINGLPMTWAWSRCQGNEVFSVRLVQVMLCTCHSLIDWVCAALLLVCGMTGIWAMIRAIVIDHCFNFKLMVIVQLCDSSSILSWYVRCRKQIGLVQNASNVYWSRLHDASTSCLRLVSRIGNKTKHHSCVCV